MTISKSDLEYWYVHKELTLKELKEKFHVGFNTLKRVLKEYDIPIRDASKARELLLSKRDDLGFQRGNVSNYTHGKYVYKKETRSIEQPPVCHLCGQIEGRMEVHHLDFNRKNNDQYNLVVLCVKCHRIEHAIYRVRYGIKAYEVE